MLSSAGLSPVTLAPKEGLTLINGTQAMTAVGGLALRFNTADGYLAIFAMDALGFAAAGCLLLRVPAVAAVPAASAGRMLAVLADRPYAVLTLLNTIMLLRMPVMRTKHCNLCEQHSIVPISAIDDDEN